MSAKSKSAKSKSKKANKSGRIQYGFTLNFPARFTLKQLSNIRHGKVKYITLYSRVKAALAEGQLVIAGEQTPKTKTRGRRQTIYQRVDAKTPVVNVSAPVAAPVAVDVPVAVDAPVAV
jgi:hypothetical protein